MANSNEGKGNNYGGVSLPPRLLGQFILWGMIALVGWSFYTTLKHETGLAVIEQRITHIEQELKNLK